MYVLKHKSRNNSFIAIDTYDDGSDHIVDTYDTDAYSGLWVFKRKSDLESILDQMSQHYGDSIPNGCQITGSEYRMYQCYVPSILTDFIITEI